MCNYRVVSVLNAVPPKVSVCITTYNHENYIRQALDSVLGQQTNFDFEILVGEDDSTDRTREIVIAYQNEHPDTISLFLNDRANVIYIDGKPTGRWNTLNLISAATGQYVAMLEGDDYWLDPAKLQSQVDFLEANPCCTICFHNAIEYQQEMDTSRPFHASAFRQVSNLMDLLESNFIPTCTVMYRRSAIPALPAWFRQIRMADWPLSLLVAQSGDIGYIDKIMGCYRQHSQGSWYSMELILKYIYIVKAYKIMKGHFYKDRIITRKIDKMLSIHHQILAKLYKDDNKLTLTMYHKLLASFMKLIALT